MFRQNKQYGRKPFKHEGNLPQTAEELKAKGLTNNSIKF